MSHSLRLQGAQRVYARHQKSLLFSTGGGTTLALSLFGSGKKDASQTGHKAKDYGVLQAIRESDSFYTMYMIDNAYAVLRKYRNSEDPEVLWRLARIICEQGKMCKNAEEKKRLFNEALEMAEKAIKNGGASGLFAAHKWYAIILDYVGEQEGTKSRIKRSYDVKVHLERALELNPLDATTWHILGVWHFTFADMPSYQRLAAKAIFGTPPSSTYEEALRHFERAESIQPGFYTANQYYLGQVYERLGQKDKAIEQYQQAFRAPVITVDDGDIHTKVYERLKKLGVQVESTVPKPPS
ncbi:Protein F33H2.6 [Aphelenchoides avenae]|nr:Protein F33H2.6 [Aphelenchus avenae]